MPAESRQTEKRVISDKKILSKKTRDRHWRSRCGLTGKQKHSSGILRNKLSRVYVIIKIYQNIMMNARKEDEKEINMCITQF